MARLTHLLDTSVYARLRLPAVAAAVQPLRAAGRVARCGVLQLEALFGSRDPEAEHRDLVAAFPVVPIHQADWDRAAEVMLALAASGRHRAAPLPDLLLAATAERARLIVLHYDHDYETIASVTGQPVQAVLPLGSQS